MSYTLASKVELGGIQLVSLYSLGARVVSENSTPLSVLWEGAAQALSLPAIVLSQVLVKQYVEHWEGHLPAHFALEGLVKSFFGKTRSDVREEAILVIKTPPSCG